MYIYIFYICIYIYIYYLGLGILLKIFLFSDTTSKHNSCSRSACFSMKTIKRLYFSLFLTHCSLFLTVDDGKFNFLPGTIYVYRHSISTQTTFDKSKNTASIAEFNFKVHIHIQECDGFMFVSTIQVYSLRNLT
jgi:hypothetical protein